MIKGQIISGSFGTICVRQKSSTPIEIGELLIGETGDIKILFQAIDLQYGSQISQQNLELISGMKLEDDQDIHIHDQSLRSYTIAILKPVLTISKNDAHSTKTLPPFLSHVRKVTEADFSFLGTPSHAFTVGTLRSGSQTLSLPIHLQTKQVLTHHILIPATTGKGKSNLMKVLLWDLLDVPYASQIVFDPHDEYYGRTGFGLRNHPAFGENAVYYSPNPPSDGSMKLVLNTTLLQPKHFSGVTSFSHPQQEFLYAMYAKHGVKWIEQLFEGCAQVEKEFQSDTISVVKRRMSGLLNISVHESGSIQTRGIFSTSQGESFITQVVNAVTAGKTLIFDTSTLSGPIELLVSSIITHAVFDAYREFRFSGVINQKPVVSIVLEEAPRVIGKDVLERGNNIFGTIAREGRKFNIGLCAITQLPSLIPKDILANMNTKIILGVEMAPERNAIIESAAQDLSDDSRNIASLDKGEAIITSNFTRFAIPIKIPKFEDFKQKSQSQPPKLFGI